MEFACSLYHHVLLQSLVLLSSLMNYMNAAEINTTQLLSPQSPPLKLESKDFHNSGAPDEQRDCKESFKAPINVFDHSRGRWGPEFKPREAQNMPLREKIIKWLDRLPWTQIDEGYWVLECYPATACTLSSCSDVKSTPDQQDRFEQQAREITRIITHNYVNNGEIPAQPMTFGFFGGNRSLELEYIAENDSSY